jgi:hypothetical protein
VKLWIRTLLPCDTVSRMEKPSISSTSDTAAIALPEITQPNICVLHIYHFNRDGSENYVIHSLRDSLTPILLPKEKRKKDKAGVSRVAKPSEVEKDGLYLSNLPAEQSGLQRFLLEALRKKVYDKAKHDPRAHPNASPSDCESLILCICQSFTAIVHHTPCVTEDTNKHQLRASLNFIFFGGGGNWSLEIFWCRMESSTTEGW